MPSFALLDDSEASAENPTSRLYTDLRQELCFTDAAQFPLVIAQVQTALQQGLYAVAIFTYELGVKLQGLTDVAGINAQQPSRFLLYQSCQQLSRDQVSDWLKQQVKESDAIAGVSELKASGTESEFVQAIKQIQNYIVAGDTYQVNYTFRYHFKTYGGLCTLYQRLRERQSVPYGALICFPDESAVLSLSPELFIRHQQGKLIARPMKGTAAASNSDDAKINDSINLNRSEVLSNDTKNRAENVMIVDLLRNDLSRVAKLGSVSVPHLFEVQRFNSVLQMTSSVTADVRDEVNLTELICAVYPCGSITGAPKYRTMQIIQEVETEPRGIYTGAIGWFDPFSDAAPQHAIPDFCMAVPIRTLHLQKPALNGNRVGVMGVGAGIVFDSIPTDEFQESQLKARFLTEMPAQFSLFETMYATKEHGCRHLERHLHRLKTSADYFAMPINLPGIKRQINLACSELVAEKTYRLKLSLDGLGQIQIQAAGLSDLNVPVKLFWATSIQQSHNQWLQHKTTQRAVYDQAWQSAEQQGGFDRLFCNERGEVTEGGRSNVLVKLNGHWYTPPLQAGVLPGVMRAVLMEDSSWSLSERTIRKDDLLEAEELAVCNALRGVLSARMA